MEELNVVENQVMEETALNEVVKNDFYDGEFTDEKEGFDFVKAGLVVGLVVGGALGVRALVKHHKNKKNEVEVASTEDLTTDLQESDE